MMKATITYRKSHWRITLAAALLMLGLMGTGVLAQSTSFEQLVYARHTSALLEHDGLVISGVQGGGLVFWQAADPTVYERLTAGAELSGNDVTDLAWTGQHLWVATLGGGLTRITDVAGQRAFRQYASNLGSLNVNAVTGVLVGQSERVYYGMDGGGVGLITDGLSGAVFTAEQDNLSSNTVNSLQVFGGDLFVATSVGISRFANNLFSDQNTGLSSLEVHDLTLDSAGNLLAGTETGLYRWDPVGEAWAQVGDSTFQVLEVSAANDLIYTRGGVVRVYNGVSWQTLSQPTGVSGAIYAGTDFWLGGQAGAGSGTEFPIRNAYVARLSGTTTFDVFEVPASQVLGANGVTFSGSSPYIGAQAWVSIISSQHGDTWQHTPFVEGVSNGLSLAMATGPDGMVWSALYAGTGLAKIDPVSGAAELINPGNSGLQGKSVVNVVVHPDGPVLTLHDLFDDEKVEILVDPDNPAAAGSWMVLPLTNGLGDGPSVWSAVVQRADVIWFAVEAVGLVRWDINGPLAGPDDPLTWLDQSDDRWDEPLTGIPGSVLDLTVVFGLEVGTDGSIWAGGNGLVQFSYDEDSRSGTLLTNVGEKTSALISGLVNGNVSDVVRDANGHIWVATASGVNRVRGSGQNFEVDTYIDLANYFANSNYGVLYSPNVISALPGITYKKIAASADRRQILVSADQGASLITVGSGGGVATPTLESAYLYPNPFRGQGGAGLAVGGLPTEATAAVEIYNLDGQLVYSDKNVTAETGFWTGTNRVGEEVSTGMYVVRVTSGGVSRAMTLAVVR